MVGFKMSRILRGCPSLGTPRTPNSSLEAIGNTPLEAWLYLSLPLWNPGDCQINDKTHFTSRPKVCSGESKLIAYLILSHQSLIQASTNNSQPWAWEQEPDGVGISQGPGLSRAEGNSVKLRLCVQSSKKSWDLRFLGWLLGSENDGDVTMMTMMMMSKTYLGLSYAKFWIIHYSCTSSFSPNNSFMRIKKLRSRDAE